MKPWKQSQDSEIREVLDMTAFIKKQMAAVDERLAQARRSAYFPVELTSEDEKTARKQRLEEMSALERRLLHDQDRKRSTTSNLHIHNRHVDIEGHIPRSSTYQPPEAASSPPYYMDQPSRLAPCSSTIAEQARMYTVGEILGTRPPVSNVDLNLLRDAVNGRPRSATENRRRSIDSHAQNGIPQRSPPPTRPRSIPAPSLSRSPAPAPAAKVGNIDKRSPTHRRGDSRANSDVVIRKPRVFSHLMKRSETMAMAENGGARGGNRWMANGRGRSHAGSSSSTSAIDGRSRSHVSDRPPSSAQQEQAQPLSSRSSALSAFSSSSPPSKLEKEPINGDAKNGQSSAAERRTSNRSSTDQLSPNSDHRSESIPNGRSTDQLSTGGRRPSNRSESIPNERRSITDYRSEQVNSRSSISDSSGSESDQSSSSSTATSPSKKSIKRRSSDDERVPSPRKQQRRMISPPSRRRTQKSPSKQQESPVPARKARHYDSGTIRAFIERKRRERKQAEKKEDNVAIDKKRTNHAYGEEEIQDYIQKRKVSENQKRKRAMERMEAAKVEQKKRMQEVLEEQKRRKRTPVAMLIGGEVPVEKPKVQQKEKEVAKKKMEDDCERRVNAIRSKYNFADDAQVGAARSGVMDARDAADANGRNLVRDPEYGQPGASSALYRQQSRAPATVPSTRDPEPTAITDQIGRGQVVNPRSQENEADEYNIINTILRKHPYLRVTTLYMPGVTNDTRAGQPTAEDRTDISAAPAAIARPRSDPISDQPRRQDQRRRLDEEDDGLSALLKSPTSEAGLSAVSSLTLSSRRNSIPGSSSEIERPRSIFADQEERSERRGERRGIETVNGETSSRTSSARGISPTAASNLRIRAGMNYMQALQYSVEQIEAVKDISALVLAEQNAAATSHYMEAEAAARRWEQQQREIRMTADLQRMRAEMDRTAAAQELRLANEMTDNQRRLMETIMTTNRHLLEHQRRHEETMARRVALEERPPPPPFLDATKLAAEVAASAATAATLAVLKHGAKSKSASSSGSRSGSATSSLSSAAATSSNETRRRSESSRTATIVEEKETRTSVSSSSKMISSRIATEEQYESGNSTVDRQISSSSQATEVPSSRIPTEIPSVSRMTSEIQSIATEAPSAASKITSEIRSVSSGTVTGSRTSYAYSPPEAGTESVVSTERASTSRSSQASVIKSEIGTQTKVSSSIEEALQTDSDYQRPSGGTSSEIATIQSASSSSKTSEVATVRSASTSTVTATKSISERRRSSETDSEEPSTSSGTTKESVKFLGALRKHLDLEKLAVDDNFSFSMSDMSEHESRVQALKSNLDEKRRVAEKLKQEYKRRVKARLENTEKSLVNQLHAYENYIVNMEKQLNDLEHVNARPRPATPPKILSPRHSSDADIPSSPGRRSTTSSPRSARLLRTSSIQRADSSSTAVVSSEAEKSTKESAETPSSDKSESISSAPSFASTPRTVASNSAHAALEKKIVEAPKVEKVVQERQESTEVDETVDEISEALDEEVESAAESSRNNDKVEDGTPRKKKDFKEHLESEAENEMKELEGFDGIYQEKQAGGEEPEVLKKIEEAAQDKIKETTRQISEDPSEIGTDHVATAADVSDVSARSSKTTTSLSSDRSSKTSTAKASGRSTSSRRRSEEEASSVMTTPRNESLETPKGSPRSLESPKESPRRERMEKIEESHQKAESMKVRGSKAVDLIVNAVLYDTIDHCMGTWRDHFQKLQETSGGHEDKNAIIGMTEARKNRLADMIVDETVKAMLDEAIKAALFWNKRPKETSPRKSLEKTQRPSTLPVAKKEDTEGVISEKQLESIRKLVSHLDGEKEIEDVSPSTNSSPRSSRSSRTPPSDRFNEAFREPPKKAEKVDVGRMVISKPDDDDLVVQDEQWMDDDFGLSTADTEDKFNAGSKKLGSPRSARLDLSKFTTEIFSAIPCTKQAIDSIVDVCVETLNDHRRMGEPLDTSRKPRDLYVVGKDDTDGKEFELSLNRESDKNFRDFLFDLCREIVDDIYNEEKGDTWSTESGEYPKWKKAPRLRFSSYAKLRPRNAAELKTIVKGAVSMHLDLEPEKNKARTKRQRAVSRRKLDKVDELLLAEIYEEEQDWTVYDEEELRVKFQLADSIWSMVLEEAVKSVGK